MSYYKSIFLVTGGCGFIGSCFIRMAIKEGWCDKVINLDKLTYSGNPLNLKEVDASLKYYFVQGDIGDQQLVSKILHEYKPTAIINFAAETHVDRSILNPFSFVETNVMGTARLLQEALVYYKALESVQKSEFRLLHISTDEVYGSLSPYDAPFSEKSPYAPNSPYAASKAASDHFVRAYYHTYGLPTLTTNCSNNYGPYQFPEKFIPLVILNALNGKALPIYGDGLNVRDWLYVDDHCRALFDILSNGISGETYNIGGQSEKTNIEIVTLICRLLDQAKPASGKKYQNLITYVKDRPGHDRRYAIDCSKLLREIGWTPRVKLEEGLKETISWYLKNSDWLRDVTHSDYHDWVKANYEVR